MKKKFDVAEKREYDELNQMANMAYSLPKDDPRRQKAIDFVQAEYGKYLERVDLPAEPLSVEKPLLGAVDWASGLARTTVGEAAKAGKALASGEAPKGGLDRLGRAFLSFIYGPAPSTGQYLEELGVPKGPSLSDTDIGQKMGLTPDSKLNISARGAAGFAGDVLSGSAWKGVGKAGDRLLGAAEQAPGKFLTGVEATAAAQRARQQEFLDAMKARTSGTPKTAAKKAATVVNEVIKGGPRYIGQELYKSRFADMDQGNIEIGKLPVSDVMMKHGGWGGTEAQIVQDMRGVMDARNKLMQALVAENNITPVKSSELFQKFFNDKDVQEAMANPASAKAAREAIQEVEAMFAESIANNPNAIPGYRGVPVGESQVDPTLRRAHNTMSGPVTDLEERTAVNPNFPKVDVLKQPQYSRGHLGQYGDPVRPDIESYSLDALDPKYNGEQLQNLKTSFQNEAFNRGAYQGKDIANAADRTKNEMARLAMTKMGHYAGESLENALETPHRQFDLFEKVPTFAAKPPVGAEYVRLNQDIASILQAAPKVAGSNGGGGISIPMTNYYTGDVWNAAKIPLARTLMSGTAQYAPSVGRAMWLNDYEQRKRANPYYYIRKVGGE